MMGRLDQVQHFPFFQVEFLIESQILLNIFCVICSMLFLSPTSQKTLSAAQYPEHVGGPDRKTAKKLEVSENVWLLRWSRNLFWWVITW
jgi:hypothetical protein